MGNNVADNPLNTDRAGRLLIHLVPEIFPVETADILARILHTKFPDDVFADTLGRGRGQGNNRYCRKFFPECFDLTVLGTELMSPHGDTMSLIHGKKCNTTTGKYCSERRGYRTFRRYVKDTNEPCRNLLFNSEPFIVGLGTVECLHADSLH